MAAPDLYLCARCGVNPCTAHVADAHGEYERVCVDCMTPEERDRNTVNS